MEKRISDIKELAQKTRQWHEHDTISQAYLEMLRAKRKTYLEMAAELQQLIEILDKHPQITQLIQKWPLPEDPDPTNLSRP